MKVLLISGHGDGDSGALGCGYKEADLTIEMVKLIKAKLDKYCTVDLYDIKRNAYKDIKNGAFKIDKYDYMLEVHFNASNGKGHGSEIFVTPKENGTSVEQGILRNLEKFFTNRGVKVSGELAVINKTKRKGISSALIEVCFIDNVSDMQIWKDNKNGVVDAIVNGIVDGFGLKPKTTSIYYKKYTGHSSRIDDVLKAIGVPSKYYGSYNKRAAIAIKNGINNYVGSANQNMTLIALAKQGKLKKV